MGREIQNTFGSAQAILTRFRAVRWDSSNGAVNTATDRFAADGLGVVQKSYIANEKNVVVRQAGPTKIDIGGAIAYLDFWTIDASGKAVKAVNPDDYVYGQYTGNAPVTPGTTVPRALASGQRATLEQFLIKRKLSEIGGGKRTATVQFDATAGVAIGTVDLDLEIPDDAIIIRSWYEVTTTFTSATDAATIALAVGGVTLKTAVAISNGANPYDDGFVEGIQDGAASNFGKTSSQDKVAATVAVEALTAGVLTLFIEYVVIAE